jgi:hypothetical protein
MGPRVGYTPGVMTFDVLPESDGCQPGVHWHARDRIVEAAGKHFSYSRWDRAFSCIN